jgi:hypothetical protein
MCVVVIRIFIIWPLDLVIWLPRKTLSEGLRCPNTSKLEIENIMRNLTALTFILLLTVSAQASHESRRGPDLAYSCETVRWASTKFSHEQLMAYAKEYGITLKQRRQAMACVSTARKAD